jgi:hypothetical protein
MKEYFEINLEFYEICHKFDDRCRNHENET